MLIVLLWGAVHMAGYTDTLSDPELDNMPLVEDVEIVTAEGLFSQASLALTSGDLNRVRSRRSRPSVECPARWSVASRGTA